MSVHNNWFHCLLYCLQEEDNLSSLIYSNNNWIPITNQTTTGPQSRRWINTSNRNKVFKSEVFFQVSRSQRFIHCSSTLCWHMVQGPVTCPQTGCPSAHLYNLYSKVMKMSLPQFSNCCCVSIVVISSSAFRIRNRCVLNIWKVASVFTSFDVPCPFLNLGNCTLKTGTPADVAWGRSAFSLKCMADR